MPDLPASSTARFIILVVIFFGLLAILLALMVGVALELIAIVSFAAIALAGAIWIVTKRGVGRK